jgi:hypothetical protein
LENTAKGLLCACVSRFILLFYKIMAKVIKRSVCYYWIINFKKCKECNAFMHFITLDLMQNSSLDFSRLKIIFQDYFSRVILNSILKHHHTFEYQYVISDWEFQPSKNNLKKYVTQYRGGGKYQRIRLQQTGMVLNLVHVSKSFC